MIIAVLWNVTPSGLAEVFSCFRAFGYLYQNTRRRIQEDGTLQIGFFFCGNKVKSKIYSLRLSETHGRWEIFIKFHSWTLKKLRPRGKNHGWKRLLILEKLNGLNSHGKVRKSSPTISRVKSEQKSNIPGCVLSLSSKNDTIIKTSGTQNPATFIIYYPSKIHSDFLKCFFSVHPCIIM